MAKRARKVTGDKEELRSALRLVEETLGVVKVEVKTGSCADLARLVQLRRELKQEVEADNIREIKVTWVEPELEYVEET